ncbi:MAG: type II toxin-antitoxin system VapB family antitoxin [Rhizomicrobium sp.]
MSALNIKDAKVAAKARRLARLKGRTITEAVSEALDESLRAATQKAAAAHQSRERQVDEIVKRFGSHIGRNPRSPWTVLENLYDERGAPR